MAFEILDHMADAGVRGSGPTLVVAFTEAARAMFALMADLVQVQPLVSVRVEAGADSPEGLLVAWLGELLRERDVRRMLFSHFEIQIWEAGGWRLAGWAWGEPIARERHRLGVEVKGATYAGVRVERSGDGWIAQCVVDL